MRFAQVVIASFVVMLLTIITTTSPLGAAPHGCCVGTVGNVDNDPQDLVDIGDVVFLVDHLFITFTPIACEEEGEIDGQPTVDIGDLIALVDNLFISFTALPNCTGGGGTEPQVGDLVITEILIDPVLLPDNAAEWFEITNLSARQIDLQGVHVAGTPATDSFTILGPQLISPGQFFTLATSANPGFTPNYVYTHFSLNNGPDKIVMSYQGALLDSVGWGSATTGKSRTLRLQAYNVIANNLDSNWCANIVPTQSGDFATPGVAGLTGCDFPISPLTPGSVVFTEFMPRPTENPEPKGEWFELYNTSSTDVYNLKGTVIRNGTDSIMINTSVYSFPNSFLLFVRDNVSFPFSAYGYGVTSFTLPNTGTTTLTLALGAMTIDVAAYSNPTSGKSRSLDPLSMSSLDNDNLSNWCDSQTAYGNTDTGTPGFDNDFYTP